MSSTAHHKAPRVVIIGSGFSGIAAAIGLKQAGFDDFTIVERAAGVGGVWRHNTYPGAACDVPAWVYSFSYEPKPDWSRPFAPQAEIQDYLEHCVHKYGLTEHLRFNTEITSATFDERRGQWRLETASGEEHVAEVLIAATGQLTRPAFPAIPGIESFTGTSFHSAEWDHTHEVTGKRVAVIGNGASAIQLIPQIAPKTAELTMFQRSAEYIIPKFDFAQPGWLKATFARLPLTQKAVRLAWWSVAGEAVNPGLVMNIPGPARHAYLAHVLALTKWNLRQHIKDPKLRAKLTPDYDLGCKRILQSSDYYPALARDNVEVVTEAITEIAPDGLVTADGVKHEVDTIIYATGFATGGFVTPMRVHGIGGTDLNKAWADGAAAYLGMSVAGFPNMFLMYGPNTNFGGGSIIYILESQARYITDAVTKLAASGASYLDVKPEVYDEFGAEMQRRLAGTVWAKGGCTSWYQTGGKVSANWPGLMLEYRHRTRKLNLDHYTVTS